MEKRYKIIRIAEDGFPLEQIKGRPLTNLLRRIFLTDHKECKECYQKRTGVIVN